MFHAVLMIAALMVILAALKASVSLVVPFLLAAFLAIMLAPPFLRMGRFGLPTSASLILMIFALGVIGLLTVTILNASLSQFTTNLPTYQNNLKDQMEGVWQRLEARGIEVPSEIFSQYLNPQAAMNYAGLVAKALSSVLGQALIIFVLTAFILAEATGFQAKLKGLPGLDEAGLQRLVRNLTDVRHYISLKAVMSLLTGVLVGTWLWYLGIDNALFMGLLAFFLNFVPTIGSFIAAIPGVILGFILFGPGMMLVTAAGYVVINVVVSNIIEPRFIGERLGISPLVVIISLIFWGWLLGPVGMLLSVPLTMLVKGMLESSDETKGYALLLGPPPSS
jgi:predicted PurR-regulated permease PerM